MEKLHKGAHRFLWVGLGIWAVCEEYGKGLCTPEPSHDAKGHTPVMQGDTSNPGSVLVHQRLVDRQVEGCRYSQRSVT